MSKKVRNSGVAIACAGLFAAVVAAAPARAADGVSVSGNFTLDLVDVAHGGTAHELRELDKLSVTVDADFEKQGWRGGSGSLTFMNTSGGMPNDDAGTLEGIDNNEVTIRRARIFEAWLQQDFGNDRGSLKAGLVDLNSEFYVNGAAGVLLAPQFGIGSELAATGPGGPSTYPQSGLAVRLELKPTNDSYVRAGLFNAHVGDLGDRGGVDTSFDEGVIEIAEAGWESDGKGKLALGVWRYSKSQDDLYDVDPLGAPVQRTSSGGYLLAEKMLLVGGDAGPTVTGFVRAGLSDGNTGPFRGSWQAGMLIGHPVASRPDSQISFAVDQALLGDKFRAASAAAGAPLGSNETHFELTYLDNLSKHLSVQPDVQYVVNPGGDAAAKSALVFMLRLQAGF